MTLNYANSLNDQVDYLSAPGQSFAEQMLNSIFNVSPRNTVIDDDEDDDSDDIVPNTDDDLYDEDDDDVFPDTDELDDDADDDDLADDDTGSTTAGLNNPPASGRGAQGRTSGRMIDHEPGSINNNDI